MKNGSLCQLIFTVGVSFDKVVISIARVTSIMLRKLLKHWMKEIEIIL